MDIQKNKKILLIGPVPPPVGGVSIHIKRLAILLEDDFDIDIIDESHIIKQEYLNIRSHRFISYFRKIKRTDLLYIHSGKRILRFYHIIAGTIFRKKVILTIHSYRSTNKFFLKTADELIFRLCNLIVIVNPDILINLTLPAGKCVSIQPFIPPKMDHEPILPAFVTSWIQDRKTNGKTIISANAWQLATYMDEDLYGLDLCIQAAQYFYEKKIPVSFIFNVSSIEKYKEKFLYYVSVIEKSDFKEDFILLNTNLSFVRLIEKTDIVVRPTNTDGDALTIREALFLGKPVIASNLGRRPEGTILFKTRDITDLVEKIIQCINDSSVCGSNQESKHEFEEYLRPYNEIITKVLN